MSITDPDLKARWFAMPTHRELAEIVGFSPSEARQPESIELGDAELGLLRDLAAGSVVADHGEGPGGSDAMEELLAKLGVASESEAIEYAIKAGVTWQ
jgi:hypothetical protein